MERVIAADRAVVDYGGGAIFGEILREEVRLLG